MIQFSKTGPIASLVAGVALGMLKKGTDVPKVALTVRTLVLIMLIPSVGVVSGLITMIGDPVKFVAVDATIASSRFQMDQHGGGCCEASLTAITFLGDRGVYFSVLADGKHQVSIISH